MTCFPQLWVKVPRHSEKKIAKKRYTSIVARVQQQSEFRSCFATRLFHCTQRHGFVHIGLHFHVYCGYPALTPLQLEALFGNAFTAGNPFWGHIYLKLVQGGILGRPVTRTCALNYKGVLPAVGNI